jgi:glycogen debranching enzyme
VIRDLFICSAVKFLGGVALTVLENLLDEVQTLGKPAWREMLTYVAGLHAQSTHPAQPPFPYAWEEIGPGYCYGPAFGHWDAIHAIFDTLDAEPEHARNQLLNYLAVQTEDGRLPGVIWMPKPGDPNRKMPRWSQTISHPPVWPLAVQAYVDLTDDVGLLARAYEALVSQIAWFEENRAADPDGFYYTDILTFDWESGVDEGVRFDNVQPGPFACVDATAHMYGVYVMAEAWGARLGAEERYDKKAVALSAYIQDQLFSEETGFFHDGWSVAPHSRRPMALEGMWPVVVGAATDAQAQRVINENLLNPSRFYTAHPVSTVGIADPDFELRMWRGPTWNSMTYWAARGCLRYRRPDAAKALLCRALDQSAAQFERTGTVWEFYHPQGGEPESLHRKPHTHYDTPCRDYLGHNPLIAMARMWERTTE